MSRPVRLNNTLVQNGEGKVKPCFSMTGARADGMNVVYFGVHSSIVKLELCDQDKDRLITLLKELDNASPQSKKGRVNRDQ